MQTLTTAAILPGDYQRVDGSQTILLDRPNTIWIIQSGSVALFAGTIAAGTIVGRRRYLFTAQAGEALFGTVSHTSDPHNYQMLAIPVEETALLRVDLTTVSQCVPEADVEIHRLLHQWIQHLGTTLTSMIIPTTSVIGAASSRYSLNPGQALQPQTNTVIWIQVQQGCLHWLGLETLAVDSDTGLFPLSDRMWLQAEAAVQVTTYSTSNISYLNQWLTGVSQLHCHLLAWLDHLAQQEAVAELQRLQAQQRLNQQVTTTALGELAATLGTQDLTYLAKDSPLLVAAGAIGRTLGVTIRPLAKSEDLRRVQDPLEALMRASKVRMRQVLLRDRWWQKDNGVLAAYRQSDQQLVVLLPRATGYELFDPVEQTQRRVDAAIAATLAPKAAMFYRPLPDHPVNALALLQFALKGCLRDILVIVLTGIAATLLGMLTPQATAILIDQAIPDSDRGVLLQVGGGLLIAAIGTALFRIAQGLAILRVETMSDVATQAAVWNRLLSLPVSFFRQYTTGDLQSRVTSISQIRRRLSGNTMINLISALFALLNLGLLLHYSIQLALVAVGVAVITIAVTTLTSVILIRKINPLLELQGALFGHTVQLINGIAKLRIAGAEERAFATWSKQYSQQVKLSLSSQRSEDLLVAFNTMMPTLTSAMLFGLTMPLLTAAHPAGTTGLTVGTFLAFNAAFHAFMDGATDLSNIATDVLQVLPQAQRAQPILDTIPEVNLSKTDPGQLTGKIAVDHVIFRYRSDGALVLDDVSLQAEPGEFIALVGGSGSGKSTLFRLLLGFETPGSGAIYYDGQDLAGLDVDAVRRQLGVVLQSGRMMSASIFENIASGAQITLDEAWEAARMAGFAEDVAAMPMAMHTVVSEGGSNLSGGQRQRLLIARALVLKPQILLFDEATSALDNRTQAIVSESLDHLKVTRFVIAHRLSTIRHADRIYVLQAGRIIQHGSFGELAAQDGLFAQLMARQTG
ncbi:NHLP bacteriocin export ABC transporter permease/ATPase subunit [Pantanalinema rosaneae CENA516]|uniref:NHLP bacteriocin export ABC transporter permease/ATPase subunit n=1 Tax=Pantanalinema rosaneae TaxID=1620701 RepID=UPI003D6FB779